MKFTRQAKPREGTERVVRKFLLLPKTLNNDTRWLEIVNIRQIYLHQTRIFGFGHIHFMKWVDGQWE